VEHVLATQCLVQAKPKTMVVRFDGHRPAGISAKDMILALIGRIGTGGAAGYAIEYAGSGIRELSMEGRMTICNMSIEAGHAPAWWHRTRPRSRGSRGGRACPRATSGRPRWADGVPFVPTTAPRSTARWMST
jgi:hypothetical protein